MEISEICSRDGGFKWHFEQKRGWMNDPNGCVFFKGRWHMFFQYREEIACKETWWGHAVSDDLVYWEELDVALKNDKKGEEIGCWSGSAIVRDGILYLFYTSAGKDANGDNYQTVSLAYSKDGVLFEKYENNPIVTFSPLGHNLHFRDPKVFEYNGKYYMLIGTEIDQTGKILCYISSDLFSWEYSHEFYSSDKHYSQRARSATLECPDFFRLGDKWVLMFSSQKYRTEVAVTGDFDGERFYPTGEEAFIDAGKELFAMQIFAGADDRTVSAGWMWNWEKPLTKGYENRIGTMCIPRELTLKNGKVYNYPVKEARGLLVTQSEYVRFDGTVITVIGESGDIVLKRDLREYNGIEKIEKIEILHDSHAVEVFVNDGEASVTQWLI